MSAATEIDEMPGSSMEHRVARDLGLDVGRIDLKCRSAFKLIEIDDKWKIIKPGQSVIDVGAAPGSWTQVLIQRTNSNGADAKKPRGTVISVDRRPIYELEGAHVLSSMDFTKEDTRRRIREILDGSKLDLVLSDMAPNASGVKSLDAENIRNLAAEVLSFAVANLRKSGCCLIKVWQGRHEGIVTEMKAHFESVKYVKPSSSHRESAEVFLLGRNFKGSANGAPEKGENT